VGVFATNVYGSRSERQLATLAMNCWQTGLDSARAYNNHNHRPASVILQALAAYGYTHLLLDAKTSPTVADSLCLPHAQ